jgi:predicted acyl esterase
LPAAIRIEGRICNPAWLGAGLLSTIEPNQPYEYTIDFWRPTGNVFARGHRIRIEISSSYFPYYLRNPNSDEDNIGLAKQFQTAQQTVFHDTDRPSHIVLPVIPSDGSGSRR